MTDWQPDDSNWLACAVCKWERTFSHRYRKGHWRVEWSWSWPFRRRVWVPDALLITCPACGFVHVKEPGQHRIVPKETNKP